MNVLLKKIQFHLVGTSLICGCLISAYGFGLRPVLVAQDRLIQTMADVEHLQQVSPALEREIAELTSRLADKQRQLRERYPIAVPADQPLLGTISTLLAKRQINLSSLREEASAAGGRVTISLQASSGYVEMLSFLHDLRRLACPARICHLTITPIDGLGERCSAQVTIEFMPATSLPVTAGIQA